MKYLYNYLLQHNLKLSSCESFTGGLFASLFTNFKGAGNLFNGGFICYTEVFKNKYININKQVIKKYGITSNKILNLMLINTQTKLESDVCFAFTGFAPPIDKTNKLSGISSVGFLIKQQAYIYQFKFNKNISRLKYKQKVIKFVLKKFKKMTK